MEAFRIRKINHMPRTPRPLCEDGSKNMVGSQVRKARANMRLTLEAVCGRVADVTNGRWIPISQDIYKIESKRRSVTDIEAAALAAALECRIGWLMLGDKAE